MQNKDIIINTPDIEKHGGVASYYDTLKPLLSNHADFFCVGSRCEEKFSRTISRMLLDYFSFIHCLLRNKYKLVVINPSLGRKAILRDGFFLLIGKLKMCRVIVFIRGWDDAYVQKLSNFERAFFRIFYGRATAVIVLAKSFVVTLKDLGITCPIYLETTTVDDSFFDEDLDFSKRNHADRFNILFLSRVEKAKGIYTTLESYQLFKQSFPTATLTIAGDGSEFEAVQRYVSKRKILDVYFPGYVRGELKRKLYLKADCFIFPTYHGEGMPNSLLEAMAAGLPVITRPIGGIRDFFEDGKMGILTESREPKEYAQHLVKLSNDPELCERIGQYNRQYAHNRFAASRVAQRLMSIVQDIIYKK